MNKEYYATRYAFDKDRKKIWKAICEYLQRYVVKNSTILDLGSGYGDFINTIHAKNKMAIDYNSDSEKFCGKNIQFFCSSSDDLSCIPDVSIGTVFVSNLFEHLDDEQISRTLSEIKRVCKKGARLIILQPNFYYAYREYFDDYTHKKIFTHIALADLLKASGFSSVKVFPKFLPFSFKSRLPKSYWLTKLYLALPIKPMAKQMLLVFEK